MSSLRISFITLSLALIAGATVMAGSDSMSKAMEKGASHTEKATFAGGCFWCMEEPFDKLPGVVSVTVGYIGGTVKNPTYKQVSAGRTGHTEAVQIVYDPSKFEYGKLLDIFWHNVDPTVRNRQFCDTGSQYRTGIFYHSEEQGRLARKSKETLGKTKPFREPIVTEITMAQEFYPAEEYHQHYYKKNPIRYKYYRNGCGRDRRLKELWGKAAGGH
jgi:peptide-methionine (S)-S-oxide reductase